MNNYFRSSAVYLFFTLNIMTLITYARFEESSMSSADWSEGVIIPPGGRKNIFNLSEQDLVPTVHRGQLHAQIYPVSVTGILIPFAPLDRLFEDSDNPIKDGLRDIFSEATGWRSMDDFFSFLGLHPYPKETDSGVYAVPYPDGTRPTYRMGFGLMERNGATGFTFSCAACHSSNLFGKTVLGLTNRFPRANDIFIKAKKSLMLTDPLIFRQFTGATKAEANLIREARRHMLAVGLRQPIALGLDTSLAQVSLSLNHRNPDSDASYNRYYEFQPRKDLFHDKHPADSKPAVWWNLKYKNRWLSDGSVISGNPILTNFLWNELGRGADLKELSNWYDNNQKTIQEITAAVFATEAPLFTDFFPAESINLDKAKAGELVFNARCAKCHGYYEKAWNSANSEELTPSERLKTTVVRYPEKTKVIDVGTDPNRRLGMKSLERLNDLNISKKYGVRVKAQKGYVPPPLVGIWARWPYFHNNSIPNLCALLTPGPQRPKVFYSGQAIDPRKDFDMSCNGYPIGSQTPEAWVNEIYAYDTNREGMHNLGHDEGIFVKDGVEILTRDDKIALIQYLQTL